MENEILAKQEFIQNSISEQLDSFEKRRKYNRSKTFMVHFLVIVLGSLVTFASGLSKYSINGHSFDKYTEVVSMILGVIITSIATYNAFFNNKRFWIIYTSTTNELKKIKDDYDYFVAGKDTKDITLQALEEFKTRIQKVLDETNNEWSSIRKS